MIDGLFWLSTPSFPSFSNRPTPVKYLPFDVWSYSLISSSMTIAVLSKPVPLPLSQDRLDAINAYLSTLSPQDILTWGLEFIDDLYQTTAFGLTGLVAIDMLSKLTDSPPPLIFLDTLYHFPETYELVEDVKKRYNVPVNVFKPYSCENVKQFEEMFGERLWEVDESTYDYAVKVCFSFRPRLVAPGFRFVSHTGRTRSKGVRNPWGESRHYRSSGNPRW